MTYSISLKIDYFFKLLKRCRSYLIRFLFLFMIAICLVNFYSSIETVFAFNLFFLLPNSLQNTLITWGNFRQDMYNKATLFIFNSTYRFPRYILIQAHCLLFYFRYFCVKINDYVNPSLFSAYLLFVSLICSRFHVAGYFIIVALLFIRIEFAVISMARFYQKNPTILHKNFPGVLIHKRGMWHQAGKIATEAAMNPQVQAVGVAVLGAVAWKALDVHDTYLQQDIAAQDRAAETARHQEALAAETVRHQEALAAETVRHQEVLKADAEQRQLDRNAEAIEREKDRQSALEIARLSSKSDSE